MENKENNLSYVDAIEQKLRLRRRKQLIIVIALVILLPLLALTLFWLGPKEYIMGDNVSVTLDTVLEDDENVLVTVNEIALLKELVLNGKVNGSELEHLLEAHGVSGKNPECIQTDSGYVQLSYEYSGREYTLGMGSDLSNFSKTAKDTGGLLERIRHENRNNETFTKTVYKLDKESLFFDSKGLLEGRWRERQNSDD